MEEIDLKRTFRRDAVSLVTGASSGIGRELARLAAADSRLVVLVARRRERIDALADELLAEHDGLGVMPIACDLSDSLSLRDLVDLIECNGIEVDHLLNGAGFGDAGPFGVQDEERLRKMVDLNSGAVVSLLNAFLPGMRERSYGRVLNIASTAALQPVPNFAVYAATKSFVLHLSEALWAEYRDTGVGISCLCPGPTDTEFFRVNRGYEGVPFARLRTMSAEVVARAGYRAMRAGRRRVVPGLLHKLATRTAAFVPRDLLLWMGKSLFTPGGKVPG